MATKDNNRFGKKGQSNSRTTSSTNGSTESSQTSGKTTAKTNEKTLTLEFLFERGLKRLHSAETQWMQALPKLAKAAESEELQEEFEQHEKETRRHIERLEKIFDRLKIDKSDVVKCMVTQTLVDDANKTIADYQPSAVRDAALIIGAQKIEHHEIAAYGSLCELADVLGHTKIADLLERTLEEEKAADETLSEIAQDVNDEALEMSHSEHHEASGSETEAW